MIAGDVANTNIYDPNDKNILIEVEKMYEEQIGWAKDAGVDFVIAETIQWTGEALIALKKIKEAGLIAVVNLAIPANDLTRDDDTPEDACKKFEDNGAEVVGLNCFRGPYHTMKHLIKIREKVSCHVSGLPVPVRTTDEFPVWFSLPDEGCNCIPDNRPFPVGIDNLYCNRYEMAEFAKDCQSKNINFIGVCCGAAPHHVREMAVALGRKPISYKYYPDMSKHFILGTDKTLSSINTEHKDKYKAEAKWLPKG